MWSLNVAALLLVIAGLVVVDAKVGDTNPQIS